MREEQEPVIRASEIGQYLFCARSWWLATVRGYKPSNVHELARGRAGHLTHGRAVLAYQVAQRLGYVFLLAACVLGLVLLWLSLRGG